MNSWDSLIADELVKRELGVHTWVDDRGGKTAHGITEREAQRLNLDIDKITPDVAWGVYREEYYMRQRCYDMHYMLAWRVCLDGLHSGKHRIVRRLQQLLNMHNSYPLAVDGLVGPKTLTGIEDASALIRDQYRMRGEHNDPDIGVKDLATQMKGLQFAHYYRICQKDETQLKWFKGWSNRIRFEPDWYSV